MDDDFNGLLSRDFGFKPQGKSAPMAPPRSSSSNNNSSSFSSVDFGLGSGAVPTKSAPIFDDHHHHHRGGSDGLSFSDVFGGPPKRSFDYDSVFKDQQSKTSSLPVFDKPVYDDDDDIFDGLPGLKSTSVTPNSSNFDDVFGSIGTTTTTATSPPKTRSLNNNTSSSSPFDDLLGNFGKLETESKRETTPEVEKDSAMFDDLLPGFGRSSSPSIARSTSESTRAQKSSTNSVKTASNMMEDPFVILQSTSTPAASSSGLYTDPLDEISKFRSTGSTKVDSSSVNRGIFDDIDSFDNLGKSVPPVSSGINKRGKDRSPLRTGPSTGGNFSAASNESVDKYPVDEAAAPSQKKMSNDDFQEYHETLFDMPNATTDFHRSVGQNVSSPSYVNASPNETNSPPRYEDISESSNDIWLTVSEVPLFTAPTSAPPPSRPPPPRPPRISKTDTGSFSSTNSRKKVNEYSFSNSASYSQSPRSARAGRSMVPTQIEELEDFAMGRTPTNASEHADVVYGEDMDANASSAAASAAAMKEAMDKAEAKFKQMREREYLKAARSREGGQLDKDMQEAQPRELRERQERLDRERLQREREEQEREQRRLEKERERAHEIEREREEKEREQRRLERERERAREIEREREKARQAVERATREARERAAADARLKAERAAVEKASAEARERAERAAVQRAQAEARERAAAEARERAERAAAEARERANTESRERAAVARAEADARQRAERAAVERAAAEARERAAAAARANQQKNENDFESFFNPRASSAPRPRNTSEPFFDTQTKGGSEAARRTSVGTTPNMKKASSTTNIVDDLSSIFGGTATGTSGDFQEVEGETEERRRARLERHQRTQERAAKALAEKNQRDLQAQREQAERHRIAETLDVEIKRWAAGKEGNLRALLSTLQYVLWPECGWQPVSLTDLITGAAVKKVYRKATLCIHPDKVQQKGANLQQKYIAEKVFDLLKEAWNKFNSEELF
ncbi:auxilin-related protein 2 [Ricinus communis]|uniref:Auxilin, putative n=1 Tax=Ricinus communis TaxID=3988 RepID=B9SF05_RICCO|nr:auxilin-related protein 2 [Ricinus communis]EEF37782.1 auxilin, putative [Ricinus communis]|eukprot:XP_002524574.1 auxilin-related protein 2 [Ricinus communis]